MERFFFSRFDNKIDRKGRVSVPARWRPILAAQAFNGCVAYPSPVLAAIEGCGLERLERLAASIDTLNPFSDAHGDFAAALLSRSSTLPFDGEGRVLLPEELIAHAGLAGTATFVGRGATFQVWNPQAYAAYERDAVARAREAAADFSLFAAGRDDGK